MKSKSGKDLAKWDKRDLLNFNFEASWKHSEFGHASTNLGDPHTQ